jgi:phosphoglycolate phosphatase-like HAD superfamily hydrolase
MQEVVCFESIQDEPRTPTASRHIVCKPQAAAFQRAMRQAGLSDPSETLFVDDSLSNVAAAHRLGMLTVLVGRRGPHEGADYVIGNFHELPQVLPHLFEPRPAVLDQSQELPKQLEGITALA